MKTNAYHRHTDFIGNYRSVYAATVDILADIFLETSGEMTRFSRKDGQGADGSQPLRTTF